jgi:hypothetical protein
VNDRQITPVLPFDKRGEHTHDRRDSPAINAVVGATAASPRDELGTGCVVLRALLYLRSSKHSYSNKEIFVS